MQRCIFFLESKAVSCHTYWPCALNPSSPPTALTGFAFQLGIGQHCIETHATHPTARLCDHFVLFTNLLVVYRGRVTFFHQTAGEVAKLGNAVPDAV